MDPDECSEDCLIQMDPDECSEDCLIQMDPDECSKNFFDNINPDEKNWNRQWRCHDRQTVQLGSIVVVAGKESHSCNSSSFLESHGLCAGDGSFKFLPYQLSMVGYWPPIITNTANGET